MRTYQLKLTHRTMPVSRDSSARFYIDSKRVSRAEYWGVYRDAISFDGMNTTQERGRWSHYTCARLPA